MEPVMTHPEEPRSSLQDEERGKSDEELKEQILDIGREGFVETLVESGEIWSRLTELGTQLDRKFQEISNRLQLEIAEQHPPQDQLQRIGGQDHRLPQNNGRLQQAQDAIGAQPKKAKLFTRFKFQSWAIGTAAIGLGTLIIYSVQTYYTALGAKAAQDALTQSSGGGTTSPPPPTPTPQLPDGLSAEDVAYIHRMIDAWIQQDAGADAKIWESMATYVDRWSPSLQGQMVFMNYLKTMSIQGQWTWDATDMMNYVQRLEDAYITNGRCADIYRTVRDMTYQQLGTPAAVPVPRFQGADLCVRALADIWHNQQLQARPAR
jgi:hypothetical protein